MDPEEFKKKYGFDKYPKQTVVPPAAPVASVIPPADPVIPVDPRTMFPGQTTGAPTLTPDAPAAAGPRVSPYVSGTDPVAQEKQAAFFEKYGFSKFTPNFFPSDPSAQPESPGRQIPGATVRVTDPTGLPTPEVRPAEGEMPWLESQIGSQGDVSPPPTSFEKGTWAFRQLGDLYSLSLIHI